MDVRIGLGRRGAFLNAPPPSLTTSTNPFPAPKPH